MLMYTKAAERGWWVETADGASHAVWGHGPLPGWARVRVDGLEVVDCAGRRVAVFAPESVRAYGFDGDRQRTVEVCVEP